jgi:hypothetical protein
VDIGALARKLRDIEHKDSKWDGVR